MQRLSCLRAFRHDLPTPVYIAARRATRRAVSQGLTSSPVFYFVAEAVRRMSAEELNALSPAAMGAVNHA